MKRIDERLSCDEERMLTDCIGQELKEIAHTKFDFQNAVAQEIKLIINDENIYVCNFDKPEDYFGSQEDVPILSIEDSVENFSNCNIISTPFNKEIKDILLVQENQQLFHHGVQTYDIFITRGIIFEFGDFQLSFEKDDWLSSNIIIRKGYDLIKEFAPTSLFEENEWEEGYKGECFRSVKKLTKEK